MGNQPGQEVDSANAAWQPPSGPRDSGGREASTQGGREVVDKHREFERQLEALHSSKTTSFQSPVPMLGSQVGVGTVSAESDQPANANPKPSIQLSPEQTEIAAKAAAEIVMRFCPNGTEVEKRRALASIRNTRQALSEMPPFELPFGGKLGESAASRSGDFGPESTDQDKVKTLSTLDEGAILPATSFAHRRHRVLCGPCDALGRPCEMLGYPPMACCSDTTSSFAVGYEDPEDFLRRQAMTRAASPSATGLAGKLPEVIPEDEAEEAGHEQLSPISTTPPRSFQGAEVTSGSGQSRQTSSLTPNPTPRSFSARSDVQETLARAEQARMQAGLVRTLSSSSSLSAPGVGGRVSPTSSFSEGSLCSARRAPPVSLGVPLAVALSHPHPAVQRQVSTSSSFSAPGQLGHLHTRQPPPPRSPSGASLPTPGRSPNHSPRSCQGQDASHAARGTNSFNNSSQHTFTQQSFVAMPMSS